MKRTLAILTLLIIASLSTQAQLDIHNRTDCNYYYQVKILDQACGLVAAPGGVINPCSDVTVNMGGNSRYEIRVSLNGATWSTYTGIGCNTGCMVAPTCPYNSPTYVLPDEIDVYITYDSCADQPCN